MAYWNRQRDQDPTHDPLPGPQGRAEVMPRKPPLTPEHHHQESSDEEAIQGGNP